MAELKTAYGGQTPKSNDEVNEVDELIQNANRLIESVYRDINMSGIGITQDPMNNSSLRTQTPPTPRQMEIQRIHRFCETIDEESRPVPRRRSGSTQGPCARPRSTQPANNVGVDINTTFLQDDSIDDSSVLAGQSVGRNTINSSNVRASFANAVNSRRNSATNPSDRRNTINMPNDSRILNTAFMSHESSNRNAVTRNITDDIIDLSSVPSVISIASIQDSGGGNTLRTNVDEDDDVIIVSCNLVDVVDLCTPVREEDHQRPSINRQSRIRVNSPSRLSYRSRSPLETPSEMMSCRSVQTSTTHIQQPQQQRQLFLAKSVSNSDSAGASAVAATVSNNSLNSSGSSNERSILMCPVCMESSVKRKPTSTKCGHVFCESCIQQALRLTHKCPMCNTKLNNRMLFRIYL